MKAKTTLILLVIAVAIGAYIKFYESTRPNTEEARRQAGNVVNFDREKLDGIVIQNGDDRIELSRHDRKWRIEAPIKDQADAAVIEGLLADLDDWRKDAIITAQELEADKNKLNEFGLTKSKLRLKLLGPAAPPEILFGKDSALEGKMYVRLENSKEAYLAAQTVRNSISKKPDDFRDKKLTDLNTGQVTRVLLKIAAGELELTKAADHWEIVKPLHARGDDQKIGDLLAQITTARIQQFVAEDRGDLHPYGLAEPRGSITLFAQDDKQGQMLQIGSVSEKEKEQIYVRFAARGWVYTLPKKLEDILNTKPNDLRDRHLARVESNMLDRITIEAPGKGKTVLARKDESWTIASRNNQPANSAEAKRLIDTVTNEQVSRFVEDVASDLPKYGLDKPQLQLTFSSFASENTAETKAGEHPLATVSFGRIDEDEVYARLGDEPFIVAVRRSLLDEIFADPLQWQELAVFKFKPQEIHRLSVTSDTERTLIRGSNNEWSWVNGSEPVNQVNVQSLVNTLSSLHAVRWIGSTAPPPAFEKVQVAITFTTSPDDKTAHKLTIGSGAGDGLWYARVDGHDGIFLISNPDFNALKLPLAGPPPAPSPAAAANAPTGSPTPTP
jgi:hypothetical protein